MEYQKYADPIGEALQDFFKTQKAEPIIVRMDTAEDEELHASYFFRDWIEMPKIEKIGLQWAKGRVLDVGCGAGSHSLALQQKGLSVKAIDISANCCEISRLRGVKECETYDFFKFNEKGFDTILLLMNGIGISGSLEGCRKLLNHAKTLLNPGGSIIFDSSDIIYLFMDEDGGADIDIAASKYYGEISYQLSYKNKNAAPFDWLFLDPDNMKDIAEECGFNVHRLDEGEHYDYICQLTLKS